MTWTITIQEATTRRVVINAHDTGGATGADITWANLSPLFDEPDVEGSVTGERTKSKKSLQLVSISHENTHGSARTTNLNWVDDEGNAVHCWSIANEAAALDFPVPISWPTGTDPHATNALQIEGPNADLADKNFTVQLEFATSSV